MNGAGASILCPRRHRARSGGLPSEEGAITFLPSWLNLDSLSIIRLAALIISLTIAVYLLTLPRKSVATMFLSAIFWGSFLFNAASFFEFAGPFYWQPRTIKNVLVLLVEDIGPALAVLSALLFAYHFPRFRHEERREFRVVLTSAVVLNAAVLGLNLYNFFVLQWRFSDTHLWNTYWLVFYASLLVQMVVAIFLLFRKAGRLSRRGHRSFLSRIVRPQGRDAEAARSLGAILLLPILAAGSALAMTYSFLPFSLATYLTWLGLLLFHFLFVVTYMNYGSDPMTLQVKVLGVVLVVILGTLGLVALFVGENSVADYRHPSPPPAPSSILFTPNALGSYDIERVPDAYDAELGPRLEMVYGRPSVAALEFDFPFFAVGYRTIHILNGPLIYLGERAPENGWGGYNPQPSIAPLIMNLDPTRGGGIHLKSRPDSVTVTWFRLPELNAENRNTIQLVLRADGRITMTLEELSPSSPPSIEQLYNYAAASTTGGNPAPGGTPAPFPPRLTGVHPGGRSVPLRPISFTRDLPWRGAGPAVIFESLEADFARFLGKRIGVLAVLTIVASIAVLLLIPLLLQTTLFAPLRLLAGAMRRVEEGHLDAAVRVRSFDEIGSLARSFNRMVDAMSRAESSFRALAEDARDGIIVFAGGKAVYANRRAADMTARAVSDLTSTQFDTLFRSATLPPYGVYPDAPIEAVLVSAHGALLPVELVYSRTLWQGGPAVATLIRDITQRKREEETAQRQQQRLMRMDKLTSLGVLAASLAHEINVPNQVIQTNASILARGSPEVEAILESSAEATGRFLIAGLEVSEFSRRLPQLLSAIRRSSSLIDGVIQDLRSFSSESPRGEAELLDVNVAVRDAVDLVATYVKRSTDRFSMDLQPGLPRVRGSATRLEQVFINLILNSCQSLANRDQAVTVSSRIGATTSTLCVIVHDEGAGIPPEILPRVREQFFTTREDRGGVGLGLFVSQEIIAAHRGTLELSSRPGVGTDAIVTLPAEGAS